MEAIENCPKLRNRTIPQIKLWVSNNKILKRVKKKWGTPAKHTIKRVFKKFIESETKSYPSTEIVEGMIQQHQELAHLTPKRIRSQIQHLKKKYRRSLNF